MPSIIPGYVYSLFAALIVGAIIVYELQRFNAKREKRSRNQQLTNIDQYVATQSLTLLTMQRKDNQNINSILDVPTQVGNQIYWISIANDSSGAWVESGFGTTVNLSQPRIYIPAQVAASGVFISSYGRAFLNTHSENQTVTLTLTSE